MAKIIINGARSKGTINRNIYGHFSGQLGRCIYGGLYVGRDSEVPNVNGMRCIPGNRLSSAPLGAA